MMHPKAEGLHRVKKWVRIPDGTKVMFRDDGREGIIDGLTELALALAAILIAGRSIVSMSEIPIGHWRFRTTCWS
jgi:hypothetical protein